MNRLKLSFALAALLLPLAMRAQFYVLGDDRASKKWSEISTERYRVIYPRGVDSLARVYATLLEQVRVPESKTSGFMPNSCYKSKMPIILHTESATSNGMVTWTPHRMELLSSPDPYSPEPTPWEFQLAVHESRHVAQLQYVASKPFRAFNILCGELLGGVLCAVYCGPSFFEGDAVVTETALSNTGRGRSSDFLEYWRVCAAAGQKRDWWQWRYGSLARFTPDYYTTGYVTAAGIRTLYDVPDFTARYYRRLESKHGIAFGNFRKTVKDVSGLGFRQVWDQITDTLAGVWADERALRAPFDNVRPLQEAPHYYAMMHSTATDGKYLYYIRGSYDQASTLYRMSPSGKEEKLGIFSPLTSKLTYGDGCLWWSESRPHPRWSLVSSSDIMRRSENGKVTRLVSGRRLYNPAPADGKVAATEYPEDGGSKVVVFDSRDGRELASYPTPDGVKAVETVWIDGELYASMVSMDGFSICRVPSWEPVLKAETCKINSLFCRDGKLYYTSDRNGVSELYSLSPADGTVMQITSSEEGANSYVFLGDTLYRSVPKPEAKLICATPVSELQPRKPVEKVHDFVFTEELSAGEPLKIDFEQKVEMSQPRNFGKLAHLMPIHSWLPVYVDDDIISHLSVDNISTDLGLGATAFFQNLLGTSQGSIAYNANPHDNSWDHAAQIKFRYTGLYPAFELNGRASTAQAVIRTPSGSDSKPQPIDGTHSLTAELKTYVPLNFSTGGWQRGLVPQVKLLVSNDRAYAESTQPWLSATASIRGYVTQRTPNRCHYPRWGIGTEVGYKMLPSYTSGYNNGTYAYLYGYVPGLFPCHSVKLSALTQGSLTPELLSDKDAGILPRGFNQESLLGFLGQYEQQTKVSAEYYFPFASLDWSGLGNWAYLRNLEAGLHADAAFFNGGLKGAQSGNLYSVGVSLAAVLGNFLWLPNETRIGVRWSYLGGSLFNTLPAGESPLKNNVFDMVFSMNM